MSAIFKRGVFTDPGDPVKPGTPAIIETQGSGSNRLALAKWLVHKDNPLTARVTVNRFWQSIFGVGLVKTAEDFGVQGEVPPHRELLDWLAAEFMESGWDVKRLLMLIMSSATYQQDSATKPEMLARDPENRLLARGPRFRLPSWMLRDAALRTAGLINPALGGPPVRPYQPAGVWEEMFMGRFTYEPSEGALQHRRTLYAFWRRAIAPTFLFDSAQRRVCEVRNARTNTPLQALTLLNDQTFMEASRTLASQVVKQGGDATTRLQWLSKRVLSRDATTQELRVLQRELDRALKHYREVPDDAVKYLQSSPANAAEVAAYTVVASLMLNLDEAITHE